MKTNPRTNSLVKDLYTLSEREGTALWKTIAKRLEKPAGTWATINLSRLNRITKKGEKIIVPGKILGSGQLDHPVEAYAFNASAAAKMSVIRAKGSLNSIEDLIKKNPQGKGIRIIK